jgi:predicted glutamine amidotransferase
MCRFIAYLGEPVLLETLVSDPPHSLLHQSRHAHHAGESTHGDGFGVGWYGERPEPAVYRDVAPAWADDNLANVCSHVRSGLFFAHVRKATDTPVARENCHPFKHGRHLFMHNGRIGGYSRVRRLLEGLLPEELYGVRRGATDSELMFLLALARVSCGESAGEAVINVFNEVSQRMAQAGITEPLRFSAAWANGQVMYAFRLASDLHPPTLFLRGSEHGTVVASEPLDDGGEPWLALPRGAVVRITRSAYLMRQVDDITPIHTSLAR